MKYYTPSLEEFHIGQEYEFKYFGKEWSKSAKIRTTEDLDFALSNYMNKEYRIKCLDVQDILDLGWTESVCGSWITFNKADWYNHLWEEGRLEIGNDEENFHVNLKCKYDLKQLMNFLNINNE